MLKKSVNSYLKSETLTYFLLTINSLRNSLYIGVNRTIAIEMTGK